MRKHRILAVMACLAIWGCGGSSPEDVDSAGDDTGDPDAKQDICGRSIYIPLRSIDFGEAQIGTTSLFDLTVTNRSADVLLLEDVSVEQAEVSSFSIASGFSRIRIAPSASVRVGIAFAPLAVGAHASTLRIESDDLDRPLIFVPLAGTGVPSPVPDIEVSPASLDFGEVFLGEARSIEVTVANTGTASLRVHEATLAKGTSSEFELISALSASDISPEARTRLLVTYRPRNSGTDRGSLTITSDDSSDPVLSLPIIGQGSTMPLPEIDVAPASLEFGDVTLGGSRSLDVEIRNTGDATLAIAAVRLGPGTGAEFSMALGSGATSVAAGAGLAVRVTYAPADEEPDSGTLIVESDDADEAAVVVSLSGRGAPLPAPEIDVSPLVLDFGDVFVGSSSRLTFSIRNRGTAPLEILGVALGSGTSPALAISSGPASSRLDPGGVAAVEVRFSPSTAGTHSGTVRIASNDTDERVVVVSLSGRGTPVPAPKILVDPLALDYGDVYIGQSLSLEVRIQNIGNADLLLTALYLEEGSSPELRLDDGSAGVRLAASASLLVSISYTPWDTGFDAGVLRIESSDTAQPVIRVPLAASGIAQLEPDIDVSPLLVRFGQLTVGQSATVSITIENAGSAALSVSPLAFAAGTSSDFAIASGFTGGTIAAGDGASIGVRYAPQSDGADTGRLLISSSDADEPMVEVQLEGSAVWPPEPQIAVSPSQLDFLAVEVGATSSLQITIRNVGDATLSISDVALLSGSSEFSVTASSGLSLAPGQSSTVSVAFRPEDAGLEQDAVRILSDDPASPAIDVALVAEGVDSTASTAETTAVTLAWDPPLLNEDGSPIANLAGFKLYRGSSPGAYQSVTDVAAATQATIDLPPGDHYLAVTAYDGAGKESRYSEELLISVP
ncbi:MAG: choice-of-anchor D domain-containing protein [Planctomycetes bacterium]|nr:choice-of-anchor D domain-containing protein [Planctomycetota bacterium]